MKRRARISPMIRIDDTTANDESNDATHPLQNNNPFYSTAINNNSSKEEGDEDDGKTEEGNVSSHRHTRSTSSVRENITLIKKHAQKRWNQLKNTCRAKINFVKAYEDINYRLLHGNPFTELTNQSLQCLLDSRESSVAKRKGTTKTQLLRGSTANKITSKVLLNYFINLSNVEDCEEKVVDFTYVESLLNIGVDINVVDKHGQSILHEIARTWHTDVAKFAIENGAVLNHPDNFGRTPLHVAAATDYAEMVEYLLECGAQIESRTYGENQTPLHYAAKNDAVHSLKTLLAYGADMNDLDYKKRSPLHIAAELDRSLTAEVLLDEGAPAGLYDDSMMTTLVLMIQKMPHVALHALDQFHEKNRANRRQLFFLNFLEPPVAEKACAAKTPLEAAVETNQHQLLLHPVFLRLIEVKWKQFGRRGAYFYNITNFLLCVFWTGLLVSMPENPKHRYYGDNIALGLTLEFLAILSLLVVLASEVWELFKARSRSRRYKRWRIREMEKDLKYTHPRWPEERSFLQREIEETNRMTSSYMRDKWNYFDWITYSTMMATVFTAVLHISIQTSLSQYTLRSVGSGMLIFMWIRMLKYARPYRLLGLFVVMLGHVAMDIIKMCFLAAHFFIPYGAAFWIIFGVYNVKGYRLINGEIFFNLFQMSLIGDFDFENLSQHSEIMSRILSGTYMFIGGVVCLNLFIAMMSDTFQRVYDNAKANAIMQRAATIIQLQSEFRCSTLERHNEWITNHCSPESLYYDDDMTSPDQNLALKKITHAIHAHVLDLQKKVDQMFDIYSESKRTKNRGEFSSTTSLRQNERSETPHDQPLKMNNHSKVSLRSIEDEETVEKQLYKLTKQIDQLQNEHHRSIIQTRAEIAGLGMMIKELIEHQDRKKKVKKRKLKTSASVSSINTVSTVTSENTLHTANTAMSENTLHTANTAMSENTLQKLKQANKLLTQKHHGEDIELIALRQFQTSSTDDVNDDAITFSKLSTKNSEEKFNEQRDEEKLQKNDMSIRRNQLRKKREERKNKNKNKQITLPPIRLRDKNSLSNNSPDEDNLTYQEKVLISVRKKLTQIDNSTETKVHKCDDEKTTRELYGEKGKTEISKNDSNHESNILREDGKTNQNTEATLSQFEKPTPGNNNDRRESNSDTKKPTPENNGHRPDSNTDIKKQDEILQRDDRKNENEDIQDVTALSEATPVISDVIENDENRNVPSAHSSFEDINHIKESNQPSHQSILNIGENNELPSTHSSVEDMNRINENNQPNDQCTLTIEENDELPRAHSSVEHIDHIKESNQPNDQSTLNIEENDDGSREYFEGYTFPEENQIATTWQSIISQITLQK